MSRLNLEIKDLSLINEADIEINKINAICGVNGSGKSTLSKYLYSFLKANSLHRRDYFIHKIVDNINYDIEYLNDIIADEDSALELLNIGDDYDELIKKYKEVLKMFEKYSIKYKHQKEEWDKKLFDVSYDIFKKICSQGVDVSTIHGYFNEKGSFGFREYNDFMTFLRENNFKKCSSYLSKFYHEEYIDRRNLWISVKDRKKNIESANRLIENYFIQEDSPYLSRKIANFILCDEWVPALLDLKNSSEHSLSLKTTNDSKPIINFSINAENSQTFDAFEYFFDNGFIDNVYYVDNVSILDFEKRNSKFNTFHVSEIIYELYPKNFMYAPRHLDEQTEKVLEKIEGIVEGHYDNSGYDFMKRRPSNEYRNTLQFRNSFADKEFNSIMSVHSLPSGIKQIGTIELLLRNYRLKKDGYLIIDEPEVNLHPEWQFKFAEILVLLAKELNITIYLNSHSPMFIEAIDAFCEFYDMENDVNYYLTQKEGNENKYDFIKIKSNQLYKLYDNLGDGYKLINKLRIRKRLSR